MTDIEGFLTIYGHSDNLLNNKSRYLVHCNLVTSEDTSRLPAGKYLVDRINACWLARSRVPKSQ